MRQRIKQTLSREKKGKFFLRRKLNTKQSHLLHSDKDTYFYKGKLSNEFSDVSDLNSSLSTKPGVAQSRRYGFRAPLPRSWRCGRFLRKGRVGSLRLSTIPLVLASFAFLLVLGYMLNPITNNSAKASATSEQDFGAGRKVSLSIINNGNTLSDGDTVSTEITAPGTVSYISNTVRIDTSKIARYYVGIHAAEDGSSNLTGTNYGETISGVGSNISTSDFGDNTWGYALTDNTTISDNALTYSTLPAYNSNSPLQYTSGLNPSDGNHELKLTFAAKINANKPADHYTTKAMVSVAADAKTLTLGDITYMQDMMPDICANTTEHQTKQLIDKRDNKSYWVTKLKDGNCWMTQNLDLDLSTDKALTPELSDVVENWTPVVSTWKAPFTVWPNDVVEPGWNYSYDVGEYIYTKPTEELNCGAGVEINTLEKCTGDKGWKNVSQLQPSTDSGMTDPVSADGAWYNAHYLAGNYYSYDTATAGTGAFVVDSGDATSSICPKGWRMMAARGEGSVYDMLSHYGFAWSPIVVENDWSSLATSLMATQDGRTYNVGLDPFYFVSGGGVDNGIAYAGSLGVYWLSTASSRTSISKSSGKLVADVQFMRASANSVRCVAR